ncbi:histidine phosphatase family protein [Psychromonas sp. B3M02]|uniref:histidine phosphatase family protein n=1 Tax=Psychromonas sp. B3M02 TaxID=2267226 RepID=UPI0015F03839|nr:histidine phosphatase family protein [Psychromonas sp. B3M02]
MTDVYLIRHGETLFNQQGCFQGHSDSPLTEKGQQQALQLAEYFKVIPLQQLYCSDLGRAQASALPLASAQQLTIKTSEQLREISYDYLDGQPKLQLTAQDKQKLQRLFSGELGYRIGEGETLQEVQERIVNKLNEIALRHPGESIAVVTHGLSIVMLLKHILHIPVDAPRHFNIHNACVCHLTCQAERWMLQSIQRND